MEGSKSEAVFDAYNLNPQLFMNEVLNSVDDMVDGAFDFYQQQASVLTGVGNTSTDKSEELSQGVSSLRLLTQTVLDNRMGMWEKYCLRHCFAVPEGFILPKAQDSSGNGLFLQDVLCDVELDPQLDSLREKIAKVGRESAELLAEIHALEKRSTLSNSYDTSVAEALQLFEENSVHEMFQAHDEELEVVEKEKTIDVAKITPPSGHERIILDESDIVGRLPLTPGRGIIIPGEEDEGVGNVAEGSSSSDKEDEEGVESEGEHKSESEDEHECEGESEGVGEGDASDEEENMQRLDRGVSSPMSAGFLECALSVSDNAIADDEVSSFPPTVTPFGHVGSPGIAIVGSSRPRVSPAISTTSQHVPRRVDLMVSESLERLRLQRDLVVRDEVQKGINGGLKMMRTWWKASKRELETVISVHWGGDAAPYLAGIESRLEELDNFLYCRDKGNAKKVESVALLKSSISSEDKEWSKERRKTKVGVVAIASSTLRIAELENELALERAKHSALIASTNAAKLSSEAIMAKMCVHKKELAQAEALPDYDEVADMEGRRCMEERLLDVASFPGLS